MNWHNHIITDPAILVGKPIIKGTRLAVEFVLGLIAQGWSESEIVRNYPGINHDQILACIAYAQERLSEEKVFSIFEPHTEWISKGKQNKKVELGHKVLIATDQYHFILHHQVIEGKADAELTIPLADKLLSKYSNIESLSLDKGFYSKENKEVLSLAIPRVVMPKKGKLNVAEKEEESQKQFKTLRNHHSAVESNINQLEHNGLDRCPDKGLRNYKRYVSLGILSYNLHRLGKILLAAQAASTTKKAA